MEALVASKFRIGRRIGFRFYVDIFLGTDIETNEEVLINRLRKESKRCELLAGGAGFPKMKAFHVVGDYNFLVMSLPGPNLEELFNVCSRKFTLKTVLMLAFQMIDRVEFMHAHSFLHRDISPYTVYLSGFDLSKSFQDKTCSHIPFRGKRSLVGTARYASIYALSGFEQSRRDDLESLGCVLMYFLRGGLPWQEIKEGTKKERREMICEKKVSVEALCEGYPPEFASYFHYCRSLRFDEKPDYLHLKRIFSNFFIREGFRYDYAFDWKIKQVQMAPSEDGGSDAKVVCNSKGVCSEEGSALESALEQLNFKSF